jgi:hypothetical protein
MEQRFKVTNLGCMNGWDEKTHDLYVKLMDKYRAESEKGLNVKKETDDKCCGFEKHYYWFADGNGFCYSVDSSD